MKISNLAFKITRKNNRSPQTPKAVSTGTQESKGSAPKESFSKSYSEETIGYLTERLVDQGGRGCLKNAALCAGALVAHVTAASVLGPVGLLIAPTAVGALSVVKAGRNGGLKNLSMLGKVQVAATALGIAALSALVMSGGSIPAAIVGKLGLTKLVVAGVIGAAWGATESRRPVDMSAKYADKKPVVSPAVTEAYFSDGNKAMAS